MGDVYDLFTKKKKIPKPKIDSVVYSTRVKACLKNIEMSGKCECDSCEDKKKLASKLFDVTKYLCKDYMDKTGKKLYMADVFEIALTVAMRFKKEILKK